MELFTLGFLMGGLIIMMIVLPLIINGRDK
jgi:hypothetical protein